MISVYITSYNKAKFLSKAIDSVLSQTLQPEEIIIIDDASTDDSRDIINGYKNRYPNKIQVRYHEKNYGISKARNTAIENCNENIITFVDADDYFFPKKLEIELTKLKSSNYGCVYSNHLFIDENGNQNGVFSKESDFPVQGEVFKENFLRSFNVESGANFHNEMFYKSSAKKIGLYDERIKIWEDWDFRIRMSKEFKYGYCSEINSVYRKIKNGLNNSKPEVHYREQIKIYKKNQHLLDDIENFEKKNIKSRIYSKLKNYFVFICKNNLNKKKYYSFIIDIIEFMITFKSKKILGVLIQELKK